MSTRPEASTAMATTLSLRRIANCVWMARAFRLSLTSTS
jgi:hypothetical protein